MGDHSSTSDVDGTRAQPDDQFFSEQQRELIATWLHENGVLPRRCPECSERTMALSGVTQLPVLSLPDAKTGEPGTFTGGGWTALVIVCPRCKHISLFGRPENGFPFEHA
jgi:hypothetical protein